MLVIEQPAVSSDLPEVGSLSRIWDQNSSEEIASMWGNIFWECQRSGRNVFVKQIDVVSFGIRWIVVKRQIASQHSVLGSESEYGYTRLMHLTY